MKLNCPYCTKEITPDTFQCPSCGTPYGLETLLLLKTLVREALLGTGMNRERMIESAISVGQQ